MNRLDVIDPVVEMSRVYDHEYPQYRCAHDKDKLFEECQDCETIVAALAFGCQIMGHDWLDVSEAGPGTGNMAIECLYCGEYYDHTLY
jgi:hypothetical protein